MDDHVAGQRGGSSRRRSRCTILALALVLALAPVAISLLLAFETVHGQGSLLANGGFEEGTSGWTNSYGSTFVTVTQPVSSGNWAASLTRSGATGDIDIHQDVIVFAGAAYTLTGWIYKDEPAFGEVCLSIEWRDPEWPLSEECISGDADYYRPITVTVFSAPPDASTARIAATAELLDADPPHPVYFDEIRLTSNMMPRGCLPLLLKNYGR